MHFNAIGLCTAADKVIWSGRRILCKSISEAFFGHPDETVAIRGELRRQAMSFIAIENLSNRLAQVWS